MVIVIIFYHYDHYDNNCSYCKIMKTKPVTVIPFAFFHKAKWENEDHPRKKAPAPPRPNITYNGFIQKLDQEEEKRRGTERKEEGEG